MSPLQSVAVLSILASAVVLSGCGSKKETAATQVAAKVNKSEISVHQINYVLQRQPGLRPEQAPAASKRVLESLIDQELAVQAASEQKLDRDPRVVMALEAARREVLARAFLDKLGDAAAKPNEDEITRYYQDHPALFAQRKIYSLREIVAEVPGDRSKELGAKAATLKPDELIGSLKTANIRHTARQTTQAPENLPMALVDKLASTPEGRPMVTVTPQGFSVVYVMATKAAPVTEDQAKRAIESFITNDRKRKLVAQGMKGLREAASITYLGQFVGGPSAAASAPQPEAASALPADSAASESLDEKSMEKGLKGLK